MAAAVVPTRSRRGVVHSEREAATDTNRIVRAGTDEEAGTRPLSLHATQDYFLCC